jgi:uncharacterized protein YggU (UPF0235/DUF167 family)
MIELTAHAEGCVLASALGLKKSQVALLSGPTNRDSRFLLRGVTVKQVRARLSQVGGE